MTNRATKIVLTLLACAVLLTPAPVFAQIAPSTPLATARVAAPAPAPAPLQVPRAGYNWDGWYLGFGLGYGGSMSDIAFNPLPNEDVFGIRAATLNPAPMGWTAGFHAGWQRPYGEWVFGIEGDFYWSSLNGQTSANPVLPDGTTFEDGTLSADQEVQFLSSFRARYGMVCKDKYFVYGTGGIAFTEINNSATSDFGLVTFNTLEGAGRTGWTIGGGIEGGFRFNANLGWRAQYLYYNFGTNEKVANPVPDVAFVQMGHTFKNATNSFTFGINYRF